MIHAIYKYMCAAALLLSVTGCGDFLKEYSQDTDYVDSWEDLNELLIGNCYLPQYQSNTLAQASDNQFFLHFLGDELDENLSTNDDNLMEYDGKERVFGYFTWQARSGQNDSYTGYNTENGNWTQMYKLINVANNIIYSVTKLKQNDNAAQLGKIKVDGEAHFLRAYYYFFLANLYGKAYDPATASSDLAVPRPRRTLRTSRSSAIPYRKSMTSYSPTSTSLTRNSRPMAPSPASTVLTPSPSTSSRAASISICRTGRWRRAMLRRSSTSILPCRTSTRSTRKPASSTPPLLSSSSPWEETPCPATR